MVVSSDDVGLEDPYLRSGKNIIDFAAVAGRSETSASSHCLFMRIERPEGIDHRDRGRPKSTRSLALEISHGRISFAGIEVSGDNEGILIIVGLQAAGEKLHTLFAGPLGEVVQMEIIDVKRPAGPFIYEASPRADSCRQIAP